MNQPQIIQLDQLEKIKGVLSLFSFQLVIFTNTVLLLTSVFDLNAFVCMNCALSLMLTV